jgi:hypothetical protein
MNQRLRKPFLNIPYLFQTGKPKELIAIAVGSARCIVSTGKASLKGF